eukprot:CAMPEP_0114253262 /NCGR_PEP_ID=MMETSP0058-20121206/16291_1 /TAXON_ID=36894 /ORGANISM="Pyramimonas parkeae, CCMP726" /LENGTH=234 /DNA_ID=CAMNT_0001367281 /DNA_START=1360 /DNA_END=2064 /DNA_ORIENTATION=-
MGSLRRLLSIESFTRNGLRSTPTYPHLGQVGDHAPTVEELKQVFETAEGQMGFSRRMALRRIFYSQDTIKEGFWDDSPLEVSSFKENWKMTVVDIDGRWYTLNNRMLYALRQHPKNMCYSAMVDVVVMPDIPSDLRWKWSTTTQGCRISVKNTSIVDEIPDSNSSPVLMIVRLLCQIVALGLLMLLVGLNIVLTDSRYAGTRHFAAQILGVVTTGLICLFIAVAFGVKFWVEAT